MISISLTEKQAMFLQSKLHDQMRLDKDKTFQENKTKWTHAQVLEAWRRIDKEYKEIQSRICISLEEELSE